MKKKLKLNDVKVNSFVTELEKSKANSVKGGKPELPETFYSCLAYVTCDVINCYLGPAS